MAPWHSMLEPRAAIRQAALTDLRTAFAAIRCAAELIARNAPSGHVRSLARAIARSAARGDRAVARLEPTKDRKDQ